MYQSHIVEISGQFAGAAVTHSGQFRFIAVDPRVDELNESLWPSLADVHRVVGHLMKTGRLPPAKPPTSDASIPNRAKSHELPPPHRSAMAATADEAVFYAGFSVL
jgi:hypothetical protein